MRHCTALRGAVRRYEALEGVLYGALRHCMYGSMRNCTGRCMLYGAMRHCTAMNNFTVLFVRTP